MIQAKRGDEVRRFDIVRTNRGGRARITLADQSILSLGSQAELKIVEADARLRNEMYVVQLHHGRLHVVLSKFVRMKVVTPGGVGEFDGGEFGVDGSTFTCSVGNYRFYRLGHDEEAETRSCTNDAPPATALPPPANQ